MKFRAATQNELDSFKKALNNWGASQGGSLASTIGDTIEIVSCQCCDVYSASFETLHEVRKIELLKRAKTKGTTPLTPATPHGKVDLWSKPTPPSFKQKFESDFEAIDTQGSEYYKGCDKCGEKGSNPCNCGTGRVKCPACHSSKQVSCQPCNGYGYFKCNNCNNGQAQARCGAGCNRDGEVSCDSCGGSGSHSGSNGNSFDCRSCNASGRVRCRACGGRAYELVPCEYCHGGKIDCEDCRGQKKVECRNCDQNGTVTCTTCNGGAKLTCKPCEGYGGHVYSERALLLAEIAGGTTVELSAFAATPPVKRLFNKKNHIQADKITTEAITQHWQDPDLQKNLVDTFVKNWDVRRPQHPLMDRLNVGQTAVLEVQFKSQGVDGHFFFECTSNELSVVKNPLTNVVNSTRDSLQGNFSRALTQYDYPTCEQLIKKATEFNFKDLASKWRSDIDRTKETVRVAEVQKFITSKKLPVLYGVGPLLWLIAGFIVPINLLALILMTAAGWFFGVEASRDTALTIESHRKEFQSKLIKLVLSLVVIAGLFIFWEALSGAKDADNAFRSGIKLTGRQ